MSDQVAADGAACGGTVNRDLYGCATSAMNDRVLAQGGCPTIDSLGCRKAGPVCAHPGVPGILGRQGSSSAGLFGRAQQVVFVEHAKALFGQDLRGQLGVIDHDGHGWSVAFEH